MVNDSGAVFWGVSAAAKLGSAWNNSGNTNHVTSSENKSLNISYKVSRAQTRTLDSASANHQQFPCITLYLGPNSLEITPECKKAFEEVDTKEKLIQFSGKYGSSSVPNMTLPVF